MDRNHRLRKSRYLRRCEGGVAGAKNGGLKAKQKEASQINVVCDRSPNDKKRYHEDGNQMMKRDKHPKESIHPGVEPGTS